MSRFPFNILFYCPVQDRNEASRNLHLWFWLICIHLLQKFSNFIFAYPHKWTCSWQASNQLCYGDHLEPRLQQIAKQCLTEVQRYFFLYLEWLWRVEVLVVGCLAEYWTMLVKVRLNRYIHVLYDTPRHTIMVLPLLREMTEQMRTTFLSLVVYSSHNVTLRSFTAQQFFMFCKVS